MLPESADRYGERYEDNSDNAHKSTDQQSLLQCIEHEGSAEMIHQVQRLEESAQDDSTL